MKRAGLSSLMFRQWTVLGLLCVAPACAEPGTDAEPCTELPTCGGTGLGPIASPTSVADGRYNRVLQLLQEELHRAVGRYIDGTLPAYEGTATFVLEYSHVRRDTASGHAVALLEETHEFLAPGGYFPVTTLHLYAPEGDLGTFIGQDHRAPGVPIREDLNREWTCTGSSTPFIEPPDRIVLDGIVCEQKDFPYTRIELDADLQRMPPLTIDYADLLLLRKVRLSGYLPEIGDKDRCLPAVVRQHEGARKIAADTAETYDCYDEADYRALSFVRTDCIATHGVAELEVGEARRCCCFLSHCHPSEYHCEPL